MPNIFTSLLNTFFPFQCCGCKRYGAPICSACARTPLTRNTEQLPRVFAPFSYQDPRVQTLIHRFKYQGEWALAPFFARWMVEALRQPFDRAQGDRFVMLSLSKHAEGFSNPLSKDGHASKLPLLVPIPLHAERLAERGYNQSEKLASALSRELKIPVAHALKRVRAGTQQALLSKEARQQNIRGAFELARPLNPSSFVLLVDDVVTTGATLTAAASTFLPNTHFLSIAFAHQSQDQEHLPNT